MSASADCCERLGALVRDTVYCYTRVTAPVGQYLTHPWPAVTSLFAISLSGMNAAQVALGASAHNIANISTARFRREQVTQSVAADGGVTTSPGRAPQEGNSFETDLVGQLAAKNLFLANLAVFRTNDQMMGALLDATS